MANATKYVTKLDKKIIYGAKQNQWFGENQQDYKDRRGLQFIHFDFVTGSLEIKVEF